MRSGNDLRVLLATDERRASDALQRQLEFEGCRVDTVHTGRDVLSAPAGLYDLVIIDLELPDMDGLSVLSQFRTGRNAGTAVVLIKGEGEPDHIVQRGLDFGASGYVIRDRLRSHVVKAGLVAMFVGPTRHEPDRRQVPRWPMARPDACPYSPGGDFRACPAFVPIDIPMGSDGEAPRTSCSHLRVGTAATWRLYPRCALGDAVAREKYLLDLSC